MAGLDYSPLVFIAAAAFAAHQGGVSGRAPRVHHLDNQRLFVAHPFTSVPSLDVEGRGVHGEDAGQVVKGEILLELRLYRFAHDCEYGRRLAAAEERDGGVQRPIHGVQLAVRRGERHRGAIRGERRCSASGGSCHGGASGGGGGGGYLRRACHGDVGWRRVERFN